MVLLRRLLLARVQLVRSVVLSESGRLVGVELAIVTQASCLELLGERQVDPCRRLDGAFRHVCEAGLGLV